MAELGPSPDWLHPMPEDPPALEVAFEACVKAYQHHKAPTHLCRQCLSEETEARIKAAARQAQAGITPAPEEFGQIYFEHPGCVGGEETIKLFLPHGLKTMLTAVPPPGFDKMSYPIVTETMLQSGFWYWSPDLIAPVRQLAARLFIDWFEEGRFTWIQHDRQDDDLMGPGDDILELCVICLIDPADLIARLSRLHTPAADAAMSFSGGFVPDAPFYVSVESGSEEKVYKSACESIKTALETREARAFLHYITPDWLQSAFYRNEKSNPNLAADLSKLENYYQIQTVKEDRAAQKDMLMDWPVLPLV